MGRMQIAMLFPFNFLHIQVSMENWAHISYIILGRPKSNFMALKVDIHLALRGR